MFVLRLHSGQRLGRHSDEKLAALTALRGENGRRRSRLTVVTQARISMLPAGRVSNPRRDKLLPFRPCPVAKRCGSARPAWSPEQNELRIRNSKCERGCGVNRTRYVAGSSEIRPRDLHGQPASPAASPSAYCWDPRAWRKRDKTAHHRAFHARMRSISFKFPICLWLAHRTLLLSGTQRIRHQSRPRRDLGAVGQSALLFKIQK